MEKLALGISLICILYVFLFLALLHWYNHDDEEEHEGPGPWSGSKRYISHILRKLYHIRIRKNSGDAIS